MKLRLLPNKVIKYLILSDLAFWTGWGLLTPVFAIFIVDKIQGGNVFVVGVAAAIYWITKSLIQPLLGIILDIFPTERDDYLVLVAGFFIISLVPFGFIFAKIPLHVYLLQGVHGFAHAMLLAGWIPIFTRHIDKGREATEWGLNAMVVGLGIGLSGAVGGWAVSQYGFTPVFISVGIFGLIGAVLLFALKEEIKGVFDHGLRFSLKDIFHREK